MFVKDIQLVNFRNYENIYFQPNQQMNIFYGQNAQGKTNLLEAIYLLLRAKSFRTNSEKEAILFNKDQSFIRGRIEVFGFDYIQEIKISQYNPKKMRINEEAISNINQYNEKSPCVLFRPEDLNMVKEGPNLRRDFIDNLIDQVDSSYEALLRQYNRVIFQRNIILKKNPDPGLLRVYQDQLVDLGSRIIKKRYESLEAFKKYAKKYHFFISYEKEKIDLTYETKISYQTSLESMKKEYQEGFNRSLETDLNLRRTSFGPHRDDLKIYINKMEAKSFASQGQQRSVLLSFKLAEVVYIEKETGQKPVLLLDDVFSELDQKRKKLFLDAIDSCQTFITTTDQVVQIQKIVPDSSVYSINQNRLFS